MAGLLAVALLRIQYYIAKESGNIEIAAPAHLATYPHIGRRRDEDLRPGLRSFPRASMSSSISR